MGSMQQLALDCQGVSGWVRWRSEGAPRELYGKKFLSSVSSHVYGQESGKRSRGSPVSSVAMCTACSYSCSIQPANSGSKRGSAPAACESGSAARRWGSANSVPFHRLCLPFQQVLNQPAQAALYGAPFARRFEWPIPRRPIQRRRSTEPGPPQVRCSNRLAPELFQEIEYACYISARFPVRRNTAVMVDGARPRIVRGDHALQPIAAPVIPID